MAVDVQTNSNLIRGCTVRGGIVGFQVSFGGSAQIQDCVVTDFINIGLALTKASSCELSNTEISRGSEAIDMDAFCSISGTSNVFEEATYATLRAWSSCTINLSGSHVLNGGGYSVDLVGEVDPPGTFDLTDNYWGTSDIAQIEGWINDSNDDPLITGTVEFQPILHEPVSRAATSFGELKSRH